MWGVVYTVDFHWTVNGETFDYSIPGGDCASLRELLGLLNMVADDPGTETDELYDFMAGIESVTFSDPGLVQVNRIEEDTTVGALRAALQVESEYSAALTDEQRAQIDARPLTAPDWALFSLRPFSTLETLTINMDNGDAFAIAVTDAQITTRVMASDGNTYKITLTFGPEAKIPLDAELEVREIPEDGAEWAVYCDRAIEVMGCGYFGKMEYARFFDIEIKKDGEKIEPAAPVQVTITYDGDTELFKNNELSVVHFADDGDEVISDLTVSTDEATVIQYTQNSFSVTGTLLQNSQSPEEGKQYMVVVKKDGQYYTVLNDGTLQSANLNDVDNNKIDVIYPMIWTYERISDSDGRHCFVHNAAARTIVTWSKLADTFYKRYIDPTSPSGINYPDVDTEAPVWVVQYGAEQGYQIEQKELPNDGANFAKRQSSALVYDSNSHRLYSSNDGSKFIGVVGSGGDMRIIGNTDTPAEIYLAEISNIDKNTNMGFIDMSNKHFVNHIDISVVGTARETVPVLPKCNYYRKVVNESTGESSFELVFTGGEEGAPEYLELSTNVDVTADDIKRATIEAYTQDPTTGARTMLDDAYYVTGYSANAELDGHGDTAQVRIEGRFKVSTIAPYDNQELVTDFQNRKDKAVNYKVSTEKEVDFPIVYKLPGTDTEVQLYDSRGNALVSSTVITLTASFNYWDDGNKCPVLYEDFDPNKTPNAEWKQGKIPRSCNGGSGMDFRLGGLETDTVKGLAVEVTKYIVDENGNLIATKTKTTSKISLWYQKLDTENGVAIKSGKKGTDRVANYNTNRETAESVLNGSKQPYGTYGSFNIFPKQTIVVGTEGHGTIYDYSVLPGMYGVQETDFESNIIDNQGREWEYKKTYLVTEYVKRNNNETNQYHYTTDYNGRADIMVSVPEVLGEYKYDDYATVHREDYLQFYIYNVYTPKKISVPLRKNWKQGNKSFDPSDSAPNAEMDVTLGRYKLVANSEAGSSVTITGNPVSVKVVKTNDYVQTLYSNDTNFYPGDKIEISWSRLWNDPATYTLPGHTATPLEVAASTPVDAVQDRITDKIRITVPQGGITINIYDPWNNLGDVYAYCYQRASEQAQTDNGMPAPPANMPDSHYEDDSSFSRVIYLPNSRSNTDWEANGNWAGTATNLEPYDEHNNPYLYYIKAVSESGMPNGTQCVIEMAEDQGVVTSHGETELMVTNFVPHAQITIEKEDNSVTPNQIKGAKFTLSIMRKGVWQQVGSEIDMTNVTSKAISDLVDGRYKLTETKAPDGYIILNRNVYFRIDGTVNLTDENGVAIGNNDADGMISLNGTVFKIQNEPGVALPNTGGVGTTMFYVAGGLITLLALVLLITKRRAD